MIIKKIHIQQFGKLQDYTLNLNSQLNMICQDNGFGKTTLLQFIKAMFYGLKDNRSKDISIRKKYDPWNKITSYGGDILFEFEGKDYHIYREFKGSKGKDTLSIYDDKGIEVKQFYPIPGEVVFKMNEKSFVKTCFIEQKNTQVNDLEDSDLKSKLTNALKTGDIYVSFTNVQEALLEEKKNYDLKTRSTKGNIATNNLKQLTNLRELQDKNQEKHQDYLNKIKQIKDLKLKQQNLTEKVEKIDDIINYFKQKEQAEKYEKYFQLQNLISAKEYEIEIKENRNLYKPFPFKIFLIIDVILFFIVFICFLMFSKCNLNQISFLSFLGIVFGMIYISELIFYKIATKHYKKRKQENEKRINELKNQLEEWKKISNETIKNEDLEEIKTICQSFVVDEEKENQKAIIENVNDIKQDIQKIENEISHLQGQISNYDDAQYENVNAEIMNCEQIKHECELQFKSLNIALETLQEANQVMNTNYSPKLKQYFIKHLKAITFDEFSDVFVDENLNVKLVTSFEPKDLSYFSQGYQDLIYFALRMAVCEMLEQKNPLFLDDPFVNLDDKNYQKAINYLNKLQENYQIIYFSCYNR